MKKFLDNLAYLIVLGIVGFFFYLIWIAISPLVIFVIIGFLIVMWACDRIE